jgi:hypothetical protein
MDHPGQTNKTITAPEGASMNLSTALIYSTLLCLLIGTSGCAMFRSDPDPAPIPVAEPETTDEPIPAGTATNETQTADEESGTVKPLQFDAIGIAFLEPSQQPDAKSEGGASEDFIEAKGYGFPSPTATNAIQKRVTATEAAQYRALANLAEKHLGVEVSRKAKTLNMAFDREEVVVNLSGSLKGISEVARSYDEKSETATVSLKMALETEKPEEPLPLEQRKARAEAAARIHATALLREKIGEAYVEQEIRIEGMEMSHQDARIHVEGLLEGVRFSEIRWTSDSICEITATLEVDQDPLDKVKKDPSNESDTDALP